jgi:hypothetical protein
MFLNMSRASLKTCIDLYNSGQMCEEAMLALEALEYFANENSQELQTL